MQPGVFRADGGVIKSGADAVRALNLPVLVLQNVAARVLQHAERAALKARGVFLRQIASPPASTPTIFTDLSSRNG